VPDVSMVDDARAQLGDQLKAVGFSEVTMLRKACEPTAIEPGQRAVAA